MRTWRTGSGVDAHLALLIVVYFAWLCFYGGLVFFYADDNVTLVRNPDLPIPLRLVDEALLTLIILSTALSSRSRLDRRYVVVYTAIVCLILIAIYIALRHWSPQSGNPTFDMMPKLFAKNIVYVAAFLYLLTLFTARKSHIWLLGVLNVLVTASLLAGLAHYFQSQGIYDVYDRRFLATYANPNSAGFVAVFNITLTYLLYVARVKTPLWSLGAVTVSAFCLFLTGSVAAVVMLAGLCGWIVLYPLWTKARQVQHGWRRRTIGAVLAVLLGLTLAFLVSPVEVRQGYLAKADSIMSRLGIAVPHETMLASKAGVAMIDKNPWDMTAGRIQAYENLSENMSTAHSFLFGIRAPWVPQDASFVNFMHLSGVIGTSIFIGTLAAPFLLGYKSRKDMLHISSKDQSRPKTGAVNIMQWTISGFVTMAVLLNFTTQYSLEIPPTNLFAFLLAFTLVKLRTKGERNIFH